MSMIVALHDTSCHNTAAVVTMAAAEFHRDG